MLSQLRDASKTWVAGIFILLLVGSFMIFGVEDVFRTPAERTVAEVGSVDIEAPEILREFERLRERLAGNGQEPIPTEQALQFGLDRMALDQVIGRTVLDEKARMLGLTTPDDVLAREIRDNEAFAGPTGSFDEQLYRELLAMNRMSPAMFEVSMRADMTRTQFVDAVAEGFVAPRALAEALFRYNGERRRVSYVVVPPSVVDDIGEPEPTELESLHAAERFRFTTPETRSFTYLALSPSALLDTIEVTEDRIVEEYEFRRNTFRDPERRTVRQVVFDTQAQADAAARRIAGGETLAQIASDRGLSAADTDLGTLARDDFFDPTVADGVFALDGPGVTDPIPGSLGVVIAEVTAIEEGKEQTLDQVRDQLREEIALEGAADAVNDLIERVEDARAEGQTLEEIGRALDLRVVSIDSVSRTGETADGNRPEGLPEDPAVLGTAFTSEEGVENDFEPLADGGYFVVRVDGVTPSDLKPFEAVRDAVLALWQERRRDSLLATEAQGVADRIRAGETFETVAGEFDARVVTPVEPLERNARDDVLSTQIIGEVFQSAEGSVVTGRAQNGEGLVVAKVTQIVPAPEDALEPALASIRRSLGDALANDSVEHLVSALRDDIGVDVNEAALARALGREGAAFP